ncbi:efflux RND transporter periplasmic adaptor subunit [Kangiella sp. HZ709]|uniref:efflux RND transporter periplasmic adaptor subunit n=1 Tax=Kangiella sp. HZ709 TaxID=2666328 RepID=UPI0012B050B2|nr:efflux RND transporter periplasmic adaptor subunit [Kangiella sp. HZ709]MRX27530.1 efflux RND transporter periplasmic adaptor subunit [Kangiella sp. HZ709]
MNKQILPIFIGTLIGIAVTTVVFLLFTSEESASTSSNASAEKKVLYWVAPMDANYRRDKPGKSPMGMDLVPVYEEGMDSMDASPGAIKISPEIVNNLGVRLAKVKTSPMTANINTVGTIAFDEDLLVHIHPRVDGWIETLNVKAEGESVTKGQPLYTIYSPELVNAQEELLFALKRGNQRLTKAALQKLESYQIAPSIINSIKKTRLVKKNITFFAPQNGIVKLLNIRQGHHVKPGTQIMSIGSIEQVWVDVEIFEKQLPWVRIGAEAEMMVDFLPGRKWNGTIDFIYPTLDSMTRTAKVRLKFFNQDKSLKPNMYAKIKINSQQTGDVLSIPREAVIRTGYQDKVVLALGDGRFKSIEVTTGFQNQEFVEIKEGLKEGEEVVVSAQFLIDSESSKTSDFKRMESAESQPNSVWVGATINEINPSQRSINVDHEAIDEWKWPMMTMDFLVGNSVDFDQLKNNMSLHLEISKSENGDFSITNIHIMDMNSKDSEPSSATVDGVINSIDTSTRVINISRGPIEKWNRPKATMDFVLSDDLDINEVNVGEEIRFTFQVADEFIILEFSKSEQSQNHADIH